MALRERPLIAMRRGLPRAAGKASFGVSEAMSNVALDHLSPSSTKFAHSLCLPSQRGVEKRLGPLIMGFAECEFEASAVGHSQVLATGSASMLR